MLMVVLSICGALAFYQYDMSIVTGFWSGATVGGFLGVWVYQSVTRDYRAKLAEHQVALTTYERSWVCFKCAHVWECVE